MHVAGEKVIIQLESKQRPWTAEQKTEKYSEREASRL